MKGRTVGDSALLMAEGDTVATAIDDLDAGEALDLGGRPVELVDGVPFGHKFALVAHEVGADVRKYGEVIGRASDAIDPGEHVHVHNVESKRGRGDLGALGEGRDPAHGEEGDSA